MEKIEGKVTMLELINFFGNDLMVVNAARVSFGKEKTDFEGSDAKLIDFLVKHGHTAPFRHPQLQFRVQCPIYVERQLRKHEIGMEIGLPPEHNSSINSISGRYVDFSDSYSKIYEWRKQSKSSKQGSEGLVENQIACSQIEQNVIDYCKTAYNNLLDLGVSKEQARTVLPLNLNTTFIWTGTLLSFIHLFNLRTKPDAQYETRFIVNEMVALVKQIEGNPFEHTLKAFGY